MWREFAEKRDDFIGGPLQDLDTTFGPISETFITDIRFDGEMFFVDGEDYGCGVNREYGGLHVEGGWFHVGTAYNHFRFKAPGK